MQCACMIRSPIILQLLPEKCGFWSLLMVILNEYGMSLGFIKMCFSAFTMTYNGSGIEIPNLYRLKSNSLYFCIHASWGFLFDMSVSDSNVRRKLHLGTYHRSSLSIDNNSRFNSYFVKMLVIFSSPPFYSDHITPPRVDDPIPNFILNNTKFFLFFRDAIGAINGSHFNAHATAADRDALRDCNGALTTNALAIC